MDGFQGRQVGLKIEAGNKNGNWGRGFSVQRLNA